MTRRTATPAKGALYAFTAIVIAMLTACSSPEQRAEAHYESGETYLKNGEHVKAGLEFRNAVKYNDKLVSAWRGLAEVEEKSVNWPGMNLALQKVVELDASDAESRVKLAKLQFAGMDLQTALKTINAANDLKPGDSEILALRGAIQLRIGDRDGARQDAEAALAKNPDNSDALGVLAADQMMDGKNAAALQFIDRGLKADPKNLGLLLFKVKIHEGEKNNAALEAVLRDIIAAYPQSKDVRKGLLMLLASQGRNKEAEEELRVMVDADPADKALALDLVRFVAAQRGVDEARTELDKLARLRPTVVDFRLALAELDYGSGKKDAALAAVNAIIAEKGVPNDTHRAKLLLGSFKQAEGDSTAALALANEVLAEDQKNGDAFGFRGNVKLETGDVDGAIADFREALAQTPNSVPLLQRIGQALEKQGSVELAAERLSEAMRLSNYQPDIVIDYVGFLTRRSRSAQILSVLEEALSRYPNDTRLLVAMSREKLNRQDWIGAQEIAEKLKTSQNTMRIGEQVMGAALLGQSKFDDSIETLKAAYEAAPETSQHLQTLVYAYLKAGKIEEAESFLNTVLAANPKNVDAYVLMGALRVAQKKPDEAEAAFKAAIAQQPESARGYFALGQFYRSNNKAKEAEETFTAGLGHKPGDLGLALGLAQMLEMRNDIDGAIAIYEKQLQSTPDAMIVINNLASLLVDYRQDQASLDRAGQLARTLESVDVPQFRDTLGWVAYRRGDYRTAVSLLEDAAEKLPNLPLVRYHLAMTYAALNRKAEAKEQLDKVAAALKDGDPLRKQVDDAYAKLASAE